MIGSGQRILVVEDEATIADVLVDYLRQAGFCPGRIEDGARALAAIRADPPDLVLLDVMLPGLDGVALCREIRNFSALPVIMVTARVEEIDRLLGLDAGADDYVCKPFSPREVVARVATVLRRVAPRPPPGDGGDGVVVDEARQRVVINGCRVELTPTEFRLFSVMAARPGRIFSRAQLLDLAYVRDQDVSDRIIDSHIKNIRRKLAALLPGRELIHSVYGLGYRFEEEG